jgi:hypothetical protein
MDRPGRQPQDAALDFGQHRQAVIGHGLLRLCIRTGAKMLVSSQNRPVLPYRHHANSWAKKYQEFLIFYVLWL